MYLDPSYQKNTTVADVHEPEIRSYNMSRIRGKDTKPEMMVRKFLHAKGFRYKLHDKSLPGKPDIVLPKYRTIIQIHGCFWHGHDGCRYYKVPGTRTEWWLDKINKTKQQDVENYMKLKDLGWNVLIIFECELKTNFDQRMLRLLDQLNNQTLQP